MHNTERMSLDQRAEQLDSIPPNITAFILQASRRKLGSTLSPLWELLVQFADLDVDLNGLASGVWVDIQKALLKHVEECIKL